MVRQHGQDDDTRRPCQRRLVRRGMPETGPQPRQNFDLRVAGGGRSRQLRQVNPTAWSGKDDSVSRLKTPGEPPSAGEKHLAGGNFTPGGTTGTARYG